jgi:hypothetical protein
MQKLIPDTHRKRNSVLISRDLDKLVEIDKKKQLKSAKTIRRNNLHRLYSFSNQIRNSSSDVVDSSDDQAIE